MQFPSLSTLFQHIKAAWQRFPAASLLAILCMIGCMVSIEQGHHREPDTWLIRFIMSTALGMPLLLGISVAAESYQWSTAKMWGARGIGLLAILCYYFTLNITTDDFSPEDAIRFAAMILIVHCGVAVAAYLTKREGSVLSFWEFNKILLAQWVMAAFYSLVLYVGISLAILGIDQLFNLDWPWRIYLHLFVVIAAGFHPLYFLSQMPKVYDLSEEDVSYTAAIRNLVKYILIPLTLLYLLILYAYILKIGLEWAWPKGYVSSLSLGFSLVGILTYLLNYRLVETDDSTFLAWFRRWFFYLLTPVVPVMLLAVGRRLTDYGVTEPRYIVAMLAIWLLMTCVYFIVSRKDDIRFIPLSLAIVAFLSVVGPWSATPVSKRSQVNALEELMTEKGLLASGKAQVSKGSLNDDERSRFYSILNFLRERNALKTIQPWFSPALDSAFQNKELNYQLADIIISHLQVETPGYVQKSGSLAFNNIQGGLPAKGYDLLFKVELGQDVVQKFQQDSLSLSINKPASLTIRKGKKKSDTFDLMPYMQKLVADHTDQFHYTNVEKPEDASISFKGQYMEVLLVPENIDYEFTNNKVIVNNLRGILLVRPLK